MTKITINENWKTISGEVMCFKDDFIRTIKKAKKNSEGEQKRLSFLSDQKSGQEIVSHLGISRQQRLRKRKIEDFIST